MRRSLAEEWVARHRGLSVANRLHPDVDPIVWGYLSGRYDADEMELRLDLRLRPHRVPGLVESGRYAREDVRRIAFESMDPVYLHLQQDYSTRTGEPWDGSVTICGVRV